MKEKKRFRIEHWKLISILMVLFDIVAIGGSFFVGLLLRESCIIGTTQENALNSTFIGSSDNSKSLKKSIQGIFLSHLCVTTANILDLYRNRSERIPYSFI